ncbi:MAG: family 43 glycosylhydrolase [Verrucomicrobia bacterium]|nr:family 43 glycosylhydrolase [Verrucomicrobiota bacterium]
MRILFVVTLLLAIRGAVAATIEPLRSAFPLKLADIRVRDPFIYADARTQTYLLYAQTGNRRENPQPGLGVDVYRSKDLENWSLPTLAFRRPEGFWGGEEIWAPEVHRVGDSFYLFVTFNGRECGHGTQILRADSPEGPFSLFSADACTPPQQTCLDGTPWVDADGTNWLVYCHEWVQVGDGRMLAVRMKPDWSARGRTDLTLHGVASGVGNAPHQQPAPRDKQLCHGRAVVVSHAGWPVADVVVQFWPGRLQLGGGDFTERADGRSVGASARPAVRARWRAQHDVPHF